MNAAHWQLHTAAIAQRLVAVGALGDYVAPRGVVVQKGESGPWWVLYHIDCDFVLQFRASASFDDHLLAHCSGNWGRSYHCLEHIVDCRRLLQAPD